MSVVTDAAVRAARPLMRAWAAVKEDQLASMPRPKDQTRVVADGPSADRILLVGSGPAMGWGVATHDLALAGSLARALRSRTGRGAVVDLIVDSSMTADGLGAVLGGAPLERYDAVVATVGTNDAVRFTTPGEWRHRIERALNTWSTRVRDGNLLLMVGVQPIRTISLFNGPLGGLADALARRFTSINDELAASIDTVQTTVLPELGPESRSSLGRRTPDDYAVWARELAAELVGHLDQAAQAGRRPRVTDGATSGVDDGEQITSMLAHNVERLDHIVTMAAAGLRAPMAVLTVLGPDTQWHVSRYGLDIDQVPIEQSFCAVAVRFDDGMVAPDARHDPRFADNPFVVADAVRYYSGVPIEDPRGRRIGALCVIDSQPRAVTTTAEVSLLRQLAERAQNVIWESIRSAKASRSDEPPSPPSVGQHAPEVEASAAQPAAQVRRMPVYSPSPMAVAIVC